MLKYLPVLLFVILLSSCGTSVYVNKFTTVAEQHKNYNEELVKVQPRITNDNFLEISIENKDTVAYTVLWNESSIILNGNLQSLSPKQVPFVAGSVGITETSQWQDGRAYNASITQGAVGVPVAQEFIPPSSKARYVPTHVNPNVWHESVDKYGTISKAKYENGNVCRFKTLETIDSFAQTFRIYLTLQSLANKQQKIVFDKTYKQTELVVANSATLEYLQTVNSDLHTTHFKLKEGSEFGYTLLAIIGIGLIALVAPDEVPQ